MTHRLYLTVGLLVLASNALQAQTLQQALDAPSLTWTTIGTGGSPGWIGQSTTSHDGVSAAKSSLVTPSATPQTATLQTTVTGPGTLTFWWNGSQPDTDGSQLVFSNGIVAQATNSGNLTWSQQTIYVGSGSQTLKWVFFAPPNATTYPGYVDQVTWTVGATAPTITSQPFSQSVVPGLNATFMATAGGTPPLSYHWQFNGTNISGATNFSLTITNVQATNLGTYRVVISNSTGTNTSTDASLEFGELAVWGENPATDSHGTAPPGATNVLQISGGTAENLLIKVDRTILNWGSTNYLASNPDTISNILNGSAFSSGGAVLNADGTVTAWGNSAITNVPANVTNVVAIAQGPTATFCMALKADGSVVVWGNLASVTNVPSTVTNIVSIAAGELHCLALKSDGTIVTWGDNSSGQRTVPAAQLYSTTNRVVAIAAGAFHSTALRSDGTVFCWGSNSSGQTNVPPTAKGVIAIAAGFAHNLALRTNGTVVAWGRNLSGQTNVPPNLSNVVAIAAGAFHSLALVGNGPAARGVAANPSIFTNSFSFSIPSQNGRVFELDYKNSLIDTNWTVNWNGAPLFAGNGTNLFLTDSTATNAQRFYQVRRW
jgi:hypothetical protein